MLSGYGKQNDGNSRTPGQHLGFESNLSCTKVIIHQLSK